MAKVETKTASVYVAAAGELLPLAVDSAHVEHVGHSYKSVIVQLPEDFSIQTLNDHPEIFRLIQKDRTRSLAEHDRVELRARDYTVFAVVNHADVEKVFLYDVRKASKPQRDVALFSDENFEVKFAQGGGFAYFRKTDGVKMSSGTYPSPEAAKSALIREQYPVTR